MNVPINLSSVLLYTPTGWSEKNRPPDLNANLHCLKHVYLDKNFNKMIILFNSKSCKKKLGQ